MARPGTSDWLSAYAWEVLGRAQSLEGHFRPVARGGGRPAWQAPVDIYETDAEIVMIVALPGVSPDNLVVQCSEGEVVVSGIRPLSFPKGAMLRRIEIPHGHFERHLPMPPGRYDLCPWVLADGCLTLTFRKLD